MNSLKRFFTLASGMLLLLLIIWLLYTALQPPVLPLGSPLPPLQFSGCSGPDTLNSGSGAPVLVMLFSLNCSHCLYELDLLEMHFSRLPVCSIWFITMDIGFDVCQDPRSWPTLANSERVWWGKSQKQQTVSLFGEAISPTLFFFNSQGLLHEKILGEVKIDKINNVLLQHERNITNRKTFSR